MVDKLVNTEANTKRIQFVESCFGNSGQPLHIPGRVLVGEGVLTKMCRKKPKPRQFFLFNDILVYGNIIINKKKYNKQHIIPLEEIKIKSLQDEGALKNGWLISSRSKSFAVYAATSTEKSEWMAHINKCVSDLLAKTGKIASSEHAAPWIPDSEASVCMHCKKSQFTLINRRHHCRNCGLVVCGMCGNKKFLLPHQSSRPLRVCLACFDKLSKSAPPNPDTLKIKPDGLKVPLNDDSDSSTSDEEDSAGAVQLPQNYNYPGNTTDTNPSSKIEENFNGTTSTDATDVVNAHQTVQGESDLQSYIIRRSPPPIPPPPTTTNISFASPILSTTSGKESDAGTTETKLLDLNLMDDNPKSENTAGDSKTLMSDDIKNIVLN